MKLREVAVYPADGLSIGEVVRRLGVNKITYYRWRREYEGMKVEQTKRLRDLEQEAGFEKIIAPDHNYSLVRPRGKASITYAN